MLAKTRGIVLHYTRFSDSSIIVTIYTEQYGRESFMVRGVTNKKSASKLAFFQPLTLLNIDMTHQPGKELQTIKELQIDIPLTDIYSDPFKNAIALFIAELLFKTLKLSTQDENLFEFLSKSIQVLDCMNEPAANYHLIFMLAMSRYLGFEPHFNSSEGQYFDLMNGEFSSLRPLHAHYLTGNLLANFSLLSKYDYFNMHELKLSRQARMDMVKTFVEYYRLHVPGFHGLNSLAVLQSLFD